MKKARATKTEQQQRIIMAFKLLVMGKASVEIIQLLTVQYGVNERQVKRYIQGARDMIRVVPGPLDDQLDLSMARMNFIFQQAVAEGELKTAIQASQHQMQLMKEKHKHAPPIPESSASTLPDSLEAIIQTLTEQ